MAKKIAGRQVVHRDGDGKVTGRGFAAPVAELAAPKMSSGGKQSGMAFVSGYVPSEDGKGVLMAVNNSGRKVPVEFQIRVFVREDATELSTEVAEF